ncbi:MAG: tripartite tricarboxylate transporter TctB family protein [Paracoccaceae bacterium]|nr:tripartite tricarboxylate transporter TctB family protein [Paracoccaceae bacterium]
MSTKNHHHKDRSTNSIAGLIFAALGVLVIWQSQQFESSGSVTPIFIGTVLILLSAALILTAYLAPHQIPAIKRPEGSLSRRFTAGMIIALWVALLPLLGFVATSIVAFLAISRTVPSEDRWRLRTYLIRGFIGAVIVVLFWFTLTTYLGIALPQARLFFQT